jgi:hypothetical protein
MSDELVNTWKELFISFFFFVIVWAKGNHKVVVMIVTAQLSFEKGTSQQVRRFTLCARKIRVLLLYMKSTRNI